MAVSFQRDAIFFAFRVTPGDTEKQVKDATVTTQTATQSVLLKYEQLMAMQKRMRGYCLKGAIPSEPRSLCRLNMTVRIFPKKLIFVLVLLGVPSLLDEAWRGPAPLPLVRFLLAHHLWHVWNELRWQHMYSHEVLHFLSGTFGFLLGCWIYFALQKRKASSSSITKDEQGRLPYTWNGNLGFSPFRSLNSGRLD